MLKRMTPTPAEDRETKANAVAERSKRVARFVQNVIPWISLLVISIAIILFFNLKADLIQCNAEFNVYDSKADAERSDAAVAKGDALDKFILDLIPLFIPGNEEAEGETLKADLKDFDTKKKAYSKSRVEFPQRPYSDFCPVGDVKETP